MADLHQGKIWTDVNNVDHEIEFMSRRHAANVIAMLERNVKVIALRDSISMSAWLYGPAGPRGEMAFDMLDSELQAEEAQKEREPLIWLRGTPLHMALQDRVSGRLGPAEADLGPHPGLGDPFGED